jgi:hypothetical protein
MHVGGIFCDLAKAFDCANHEMLTKLHFHGIQGIVTKWFRSYPTDRQQKVEITSQKQNFFSNWGTIKHGVFQGSILGPLLFIIYIHDFPPTINTLSDPIIFSDDRNVIISRKNFYDFCTMSNIVPPHMRKWFTANKLALNLDKTNIIKFKAHNSPQYALSIGYNVK